jgi:hypothetical protein
MGGILQSVAFGEFLYDTVDPLLRVSDNPIKIVEWPLYNKDLSSPWHGCYYVGLPKILVLLYRHRSGGTLIQTESGSLSKTSPI